MQTDTHIIIFAKAPLPGFAKTRLIPALGQSGAAKLAQHLFYHSIDQAINAQLGTVELCVTPGLEDVCWQDFPLPKDLIISEQGEGDLGARMARATQRALKAHRSVLLIGTDCPGLTASMLNDAAALLNQHDACLIPVSDGGYALLGLRHFDETLFSHIPWSTAEVAALTRARLHALNWSLAELAELHDIDEPGDLYYLPSHFTRPFSS
jgi:rSAM/selenodomain-associated transferase 1